MTIQRKIANLDIRRNQDKDSKKKKEEKTPLASIPTPVIVKEKKEIDFKTIGVKRFVPKNKNKATSVPANDNDKVTHSTPQKVAIPAILSKSMTTMTHQEHDLDEKVSPHDPTMTSISPAMNDVSVIRLQQILQSFDKSYHEICELLSSLGLISSITSPSDNTNKLSTAIQSINSNKSDKESTTTSNASSFSLGSSMRQSNEKESFKPSNMCEKLFDVSIAFDLSLSSHLTHEKHSNYNHETNDTFSSDEFCFVLEGYPNEFRNISKEEKLEMKDSKSRKYHTKGHNSINGTKNRLILEGGSFHHLFACPNDWIAVGFRCRLESIAMIMMKREERIVRDYQSQFNQEISHERSISDILILNHFPHVMIATISLESYNSLPASKESRNSLSGGHSQGLLEQYMVQYLQSEGIRATNMMQDLQFGMNSPILCHSQENVPSLVRLCHLYGIPMIIILPLDSLDDIKIYPRPSIYSRKESNPSNSRSGISPSTLPDIITCSMDKLLFHVRYVLQVMKILIDPSSKDSSPSNNVPVPTTQSNSSTRMSTKGNPAINPAPSESNSMNPHVGSPSISSAAVSHSSRSIGLLYLESNGTTSSTPGKSISKSKKLRAIEQQIYHYFMNYIFHGTVNFDLKIQFVTSFHVITSNVQSSSSSASNEMDGKKSISHNLGAMDYKIIATELSFPYLREFGTAFMKLLARNNPNIPTNQTMSNIGPNPSSTHPASHKEGSASQQAAEFTNFVKYHPHRKLFKSIAMEIMKLRSSITRNASNISSMGEMNSLHSFNAYSGINTFYKDSLPMNVYLFSLLDHMMDMISIDIIALDLKRGILSNI